MKRIKIFFRLKWEEISSFIFGRNGWFIAMTFGIFVSVCAIPVAIINKGKMSIIVYISGLIIILSSILWMIWTEEIYPWLKSNWEKAGRIAKEK